MDQTQNLKRSALKFIVMFGFISLFADITYEGARSIIGPYFVTLGASAAVVGIFSGLGEFVGYALRIISGYISDKTRKYWTMVIIGYVLNLIAIPLLALAGRWEIAAGLIIVERMGKAIRAPSRDAILTPATKQIGTGWGFGLHEAMDQIGALTGPLIVTAVLFFKGTYQQSFVVLFIPAILAIAILVLTRVLYPSPESFETKKLNLTGSGLPRLYWIYLIGTGFIAAGFADFPLIAFHIKKIGATTDTFIPVLYAIAMGVDGISALVCGKLFDKVGIKTLAWVAMLSAFFAPLVFLGTMPAIVIGVVLWGIGMGAQESIMRAAVGSMVSSDRRGSAYGIFNTGFGLFWFLGSALMGILYDRSIPWLIVFSMICQFASVPFLLMTKKQGRKA